MGSEEGLECVTQLHRYEKGTYHRQDTVFEVVQARLDEQQIRARLYGQESGSGHVDTGGVLEVLDGGTDSGLQLNDSLTGIRHLVVDNDFQVELVVVNHSLDGLQVDPDVVRVEDLEFLDRLEVFQVVSRDLGDFEQSDLSVVVDNSTTLDIRLCLVGHFHDILGLLVNNALQDAEIDNGTQVVNVGNENVFLAGIDELVEQTRVAERVKDVSVSGRVPLGLVVVGRSGDGKHRVLAESRVSRLVEGEDVDVVVF